MSGGTSCQCAQRKLPAGERRWVVVQRHCNHSAFNGYRQTYSDWSCLRCRECGALWRTKASYVHSLADDSHALREADLKRRAGLPVGVTP